MCTSGSRSEESLQRFAQFAYRIILFVIDARRRLFQGEQADWLPADGGRFRHQSFLLCGARETVASASLGHLPVDIHRPLPLHSLHLISSECLPVNSHYGWQDSSMHRYIAILFPRYVSRYYFLQSQFVFIFVVNFFLIFFNS